MTEATDLASAIGQCVAAVAAVVGLGFIGWQVRQARKGSDLQSLQTFLWDAKEHEHALLRATTAEEKDQAFIEFVHTPPPKGGGFELRLKAGSIGPLGR